VLDATIVNVAIPTIHRSLHFSVANLQWLVTAYSLTFGGLLLLGGRAGDLFGKRRMFMAGIGLFAVASLLGGLAQDDVWLIITRGLQGVGGAIASPTALSLVVTNFPEGPRRNRAMGVYAAMSGAGGALGLLLGGILSDYASWRWIFLVNVPIGALVLLLAPRSLHESDVTMGRLELPGAITATAGMLSLVYGISNASIHSWGSTGTVLPMGLGALLLISFVLIETRSQAPLMPLSIFANRNRSAGYVIMTCTGAAGFSVFFFLSQFFQNVEHWSPVKTGVGFLPVTLGIMVAANVVSRLVGRIGVRAPLLLGPASLTTALLLLTRLKATSSYGEVVVSLLLIAAAMGLSFVPLTLTIASGVRPHEAGLASALLNTGQQVGGALGLSVLATIATSAMRRSLAHGAGPAVAITHGYGTAFAVAAGIAGTGFLVSLLVVRRPSPVTEGRHPVVVEVPVSAVDSDRRIAVAQPVPVDEA